MKGKKVIITLVTSSIILIIFFLFLDRKRNAKKNQENIVTIIGKIPEAIDSTEVGICRFIDDNPENYFFKNDSNIIMDSSFTSSFQINGTGIITLMPNEYMPKIFIICDNGGSIEFVVSRKEKLYDINFFGKNSKGQKLFNSSNLFKVNRLTQIINEKILQKNYSSEETIFEIERLKDSLFMPFKDFLKSEEITPSFFHVVKAQAEMKLLSSVNHVIEYNKYRKKTTSHKEEELDEINTYFFSRYDPFLDKYKNVDLISRVVNASSKCILIESKALKGSLNDLGLWQNHQTPNSYAPLELQEKMKAVDIMLNRSFEHNNLQVDKEDFLLFKKAFPNSPYNEPLAQLFEDENSKLITPAYTFADYSGVQKQISITKVLGDGNLDTLLANDFKNKNVFVDIWATWCAPCIQEFKYVEALHEFLIKNDIEMLYLSVDAASAGNKWNDGIIKHKLKGKHFLATKDSYPSLERKLGMDVLNIPKYLLFDKNGKLLDGDLPRPSTGNILFERINQLLN